MGVHCSGHYSTSGCDFWQRSSHSGVNLFQDCPSSKCFYNVDLWTLGNQAAVCCIFLFSELFQGLVFNLQLSFSVNLCMYVFMCGLHSTTQLFSVEEMQIHPGCSSQQLFVQKFLFFNSGENGNTSFFFQFLKYFWFDWAVEEFECVWNKPLSGNGLEAQFCSLGSQC